MQLSVVIVNYNVKYFLEQCLGSVQHAIANIDAEVFVVDNNSVDGSMLMVAEKYPWVKRIENKENVGFSKANNQAILQSIGKVVLLLNPDTVVQQDTFTKVLEFMTQHPECGGLGVKMIDGKGKFLPESRRGLPTPDVALYKMCGLAALFPKSKVFGKYHLGYLDKNETNEVEILSGACMFISREAINKAGLLDEQFFMYGEDIDLSYRIIKAGFKNYYFAGTTIIHYKGESTKKQSAHFVKVFYKAMVIFARKHFTKGSARMLSGLIESAIWLRAFMALIVRFLKKVWLPILDFVASYAAWYGVISYWEHYNKFVRKVYPSEYFYVHVPAYLMLILIMVAFSGGLKTESKPVKIFRGWFAGAILLFAIFGFLPKSMQFSRAILLLGSVFTLLTLFANRMIIHWLKYRNFNLGQKVEEKTILVGSETEINRVMSIMSKSLEKLQPVGYVSTELAQKVGRPWLGGISQLKDIIMVFGVTEIIFCGKDVHSESIIKAMVDYSDKGVKFKIVPEGSEYVIGSNSKNIPGEWYTVDVNLHLAQKRYQKLKRAFDIVWCFGVILLSPFLIIRGSFVTQFKNISKVLSGRTTWVSYHGYNEKSLLPVLVPGVYTPWALYKELDTDLINPFMYNYARYYSIVMDLKICVWAV